MSMSATIICFKKARIARLSRVQRCDAIRFHELMAVPDVRIELTRRNEVLLKRNGAVIAAALAGNYFIDPAA